MPSAFEALNDLINSKQKAIAAIKADTDAKLDVKNQLIKHLADTDKDLDTLSCILKEHEDDVCKLVTIVQELNNLGCIKESLNRNIGACDEDHKLQYLNKIAEELKKCRFLYKREEGDSIVYAFGNDYLNILHTFILAGWKEPIRTETLVFRYISPARHESDYNTFCFTDGQGVKFKFKHR